MDEIFNRFNRVQKPVTIEDLQIEIKEIKQELAIQETRQIKLENEDIKDMIQNTSDQNIE